jgi:hypothetical protein
MTHDIYLSDQFTTVYEERAKQAFEFCEQENVFVFWFQLTQQMECEYYICQGCPVDQHLPSLNYF